MKITVIVNLALLLSVVLAGGCTVFPNPEPPRVMDLAAVEKPPVVNQRFSASLRVDTPYASEPFNSTRILAKPTSWEFRAYEGVRWRDTVPVVVRDTLVNALRHSEAFVSVVSDTNPANAELTLISELSGFHAESPENEPKIVIEVNMQLVHNRSRASVCTRNFRIVEAASGPGIDQIVEAFGAAGSNLASSVIRWATECDLPSRQEKDQPRQP